MIDNIRIISNNNYDTTFIDSTGTAVLDFKAYPPTVSKIQNKRTKASTAICDDNGNLLFYVDGCGVYDKEHGLMEDGEFIGKSNYFYKCNSAFLDPLLIFHDEPKIILPMPGNPNHYIIFYMKYRTFFNKIELLYATIDLSKNNGLGKVKNYDVPMAPPDKYNFQINAVRHSNGIDWLIFVRLMQKKMLMFLFDSDGLHSPRIFNFDKDLEQDFGSICGFSKLGDKYFEFGDTTCRIYDFDRCKMEFSNLQEFKVETIGDSVKKTYIVIAEFSPDSRFFYTASYDTLFQYDISSGKPPFPKCLIATTGVEPFVAFGTDIRSFYNSFLGPDNKIYLNGISYPFLHVIHNPNEAGDACNFEMDAINLPVLPMWFQRYPNYNLGAVDPPCTSAVPDLKKGQEFSIFPNPAANTLTIRFENPATGTWKMIDTNGKVGFSGNCTNWQQQSVDLSNFVSGIYVLSFSFENGDLSHQRFVISK